VTECIENVTVHDLFDMLKVEAPLSKSDLPDKVLAGMLCNVNYDADTHSVLLKIFCHHKRNGNVIENIIPVRFEVYEATIDIKEIIFDCKKKSIYLIYMSGGLDNVEMVLTDAWASPFPDNKVIKENHLKVKFNSYVTLNEAELWFIENYRRIPEEDDEGLDNVDFWRTEGERGCNLRIRPIYPYSKGYRTISNEWDFIYTGKIAKK